MKNLPELRDELEAGITTGFNLVRMTQKCDGLFNEYTIFEKTKRMIAMSLLYQANTLIKHSIVEMESDELYTSCRESFNDYLENDNLNEELGVYRFIDKWEEVFENTYGDFDTITETIDDAITKLSKTKTPDVFISEEVLFLCLLIINAVEFGYPSELMFFYESHLTPESGEVAEVQFQLTEEKPQDHVGI